MSTLSKKEFSLGATTAVTVAVAMHADASADVQELLAGIRDESEDVRYQAWIKAGSVGAPAVKPLAETMKDDELEVGRAARRALWAIVRHVGQPENDRQREAVVTELLALLKPTYSSAVRREAVWMLSEICGDEAVAPVADLVTNHELREDARMVLQRIPGEKSLAALKTALKIVPDDFKLNVAQSLRQRGVTVPGLPCQKLVPTIPTSVNAIKT